MTLRPRHVVPLLAAVAAVGCGSDDEPKGEELPRATVAQLERRLDEIDRRYNDARDNGNPGACDDIERDSFPAIENLLAGLPNDVDPDVRKATEDSFTRLRELTSDGCSDVEPAETETETAPPETEVETIPPETVPPQTQTTPPETDTVPPDEDGTTNGDGGASPDQGGGGLQAPPAGDGE